MSRTSVSVRQLGRCIEAAEASDVPVWAAFERLSNSLERMVQIQMGAYPAAWSDDDKREMAERELFGVPDQPRNDNAA